MSFEDFQNTASASTQSISEEDSANTALAAKGVAESRLSNISQVLHDAAAQNDLIAESLAPAVEDFLQHDLERKILGKIDFDKVVAPPKPLEMIDMEQVMGKFPVPKAITELRLPQSQSRSLALQPGDCVSLEASE